MSTLATAASSPAALAQVQSSLVTLFEDVRGLDVRAYERTEAGPEVETLALQVGGFIGRALALSGELQNRYEPSGGEVADVAFLAAMELKQRLAPLEAPPRADSWERVCDCASAIRCVTMSLGALDRALAAAEQVSPVLDQGRELGTSLEIRRLYRKLWRFVAEAGEVGAPEVHARLRTAGTLIAILVGRDEYPHMRGNDRLQLTSLQRRILGWMGQPEPDLRAGGRLWDDFAGFARMLRQVNLRQELAQHDHDTLAEAAHTLARLPPSGAVSSEVLARLRRLEGLDDSLDDALLDREPTPAALLAALARVPRRGALGEAFATAG